MKKILIATTALVATAGVAAADVSVSGWAYGMVQAGDALVADGGSEFARGGRVQFGASTQTDGGLGLSYYSRMTSYNGDAAEAGLQWNRVSMSMNGMSLDLGNANGAGQSTARHAVGYIGVDNGTVGAVLGLADNRMTGAHSDGGDRAVFKYAMGSVLVSASANLNGSGTTEFGVRYSDNGLTVGYAANNSDAWQALVSYQFGDVTVAAGANDAETTTGSISYNVGGGLTVTAIGASRSAGNSYGIDVSYDLGGGATFAAQFGEDADGLKGAAAGVVFSF